MSPALAAASVDLAHSGWAHSGWLSAALAVAWGIAALLLPLAPHRARRQLTIALIAAGIPVLGWVTYCCGPSLGLAAFALGFLTLTTRPLARRRRRGRRDGAMLAPPAD